MLSITCTYDNTEKYLNILRNKHMIPAVKLEPPDPGKFDIIIMVTQISRFLKILGFLLPFSCLSTVFVQNFSDFLSGPETLDFGDFVPCGGGLWGVPPACAAATWIGKRWSSRLGKFYSNGGDRQPAVSGEQCVCVLAPRNHPAQLRCDGRLEKSCNSESASHNPLRRYRCRYANCFQWKKTK